MRKFVSVLLILIMATCMIVASFPSSAAVTSSAPSRVVNVVYDDSGSMIKTKDQLVDTWCQAKYAMEVFAAMLSSKDTMNIYVMSDFEGGTSKEPRLQLKGQEGTATNVKKIHEMVTRAGNTPFNSVHKAYSDIVAATADEKWLVVLTDGEFQNAGDIDAFFAQKASDVNVMFLGMGPDADAIAANEGNSLYYVEAKDNSQILTKITDISTRIFNRDKLDVNVTAKTFSFDIPMSELIVFAQGNNVSVKGIKSSDGTVFQSSTEPVSVRYSETPTTNTNYPDFIVDKSLQGCIATYKDDFIAGDYSIDISNAETIEIYYKPNIEIAAYLKDSDGNEVTDLTDLAAGEYTIEFGFVKSGTNDKIGNSKLLGKVTYEAKVTNNEVQHEKTYASGDKISIEEGSLAIDVIGHYLDYNSVATRLDYSIFKDKAITFELIEGPTYVVEDSGFVDATPMKVKVLADGKELTEEQWRSLAIPKAKLSKSQEFEVDDFLVEKSEQTGVLNVTPKLKKDKPSTGTYTDCGYTLSYDEQHGNESWRGESEVQMKMQDNRSWFARNKGKIIKYGILLLLLLILLGYMPFVKHYLPKKLKSKPNIERSSNTPGLILTDVKGDYRKSFASTVIPYVAQKGTIKVVPAGVAGVPKLEVKGIKGNKMSITNIKDFAGKEYVTFNGESIPKEHSQKHMDTSAGITIGVERNGCMHTCIPNV